MQTEDELTVTGDDGGGVAVDRGRASLGWVAMAGWGWGRLWGELRWLGEGEEWRMAGWTVVRWWVGVTGSWNCFKRGIRFNSIFFFFEDRFNSIENEIDKTYYLYRRWAWARLSLNELEPHLIRTEERWWCWRRRSKTVDEDEADGDGSSQRTAWWGKNTG